MRQSVKTWLYWLLYGSAFQKNNNGFPKHDFKILIYRFLGFATFGYAGIQLYIFHSQSDSIPNEIVWFWMIWLLGYTVLKEAFRWAEVNSHNHYGEFFAILIIATFLWMESYSVLGHWISGRLYMRIPAGYFDSAVEAFVLLILSTISSLRFHHGQRASSQKEA